GGGRGRGGRGGGAGWWGGGRGGEAALGEGAGQGERARGRGVHRPAGSRPGSTPTLQPPRAWSTGTGESLRYNPGTWRTRPTTPPVCRSAPIVRNGRPPPIRIRRPAPCAWRRGPCSRVSSSIASFNPHSPQ